MLAAREIFKKESVTNLNLHSIPVFRLKLIRLAKNSHVLSFVVHHGIADGNSLEVFYTQLSKAYRDLTHGKPVLLPKPKVGFRQYEKSLEAWLARGNQERLMAFWERQFHTLS
jgi:NRPS condensation-like uncharacterized protein